MKIESPQQRRPLAPESAPNHEAGFHDPTAQDGDGSRVVTLEEAGADEAQLREWPAIVVAPHLEVRQSVIHGLGLFATADIDEGAVIGEYEGPRTRKNGSHVLWIEDDDGSVYGIEGRNFLRYVNHSPEPNAVFHGEELVATRTIRPDEEITHHYGDDWD